MKYSISYLLYFDCDNSEPHRALLIMLIKYDTSKRGEDLNDWSVYAIILNIGKALLNYFFNKFIK